ncbi:nitroreductase [Natranaerovirga hydrolytica]|uniref:Nitroreductase n=1 Tax=Natranaerovirga hydrolytica TaxID=680378 RepID=A0A4R1M9C1_9FIRM|nr:nitroreductase family protein [Natranaerovirga hydrolytica]TCK88012.1 nitroreductase [Natranaerovirga hydrolytica]
MDFLELAKRRYSVRKYQDKEVEKEKLLNIVEAARIAPSAVNFQPWHFIIINDKEMIEKISQVYSKSWFSKAPAIIVACSDHSISWRRSDGKDYSDVDLGIAIDHMTLAATELGLGTCWVCAFNSYQCHTLLELPRSMEVVALLPVGYPLNESDIERHQTQRKTINEIISWNKYKN